MHVPLTGTARQMMRSAAGQEREQQEMDDFARDMGGRMIIRVRCCCVSLGGRPHLPGLLADLTDL